MCPFFFFIVSEKNGFIQCSEEIYQLLHNTSTYDVCLYVILYLLQYYTLDYIGILDTRNHECFFFLLFDVIRNTQLCN